MAFDGNGNWVSNYSAVAQRDADLPILASNFDNILLADLATSFENCLTKDGQVKVQQAFDANSYKVINVANPTNPQDAVNLQTLQSTTSNGIDDLLEALYPVGSLYIGTQSTCPLESLISGSTWTLVATDRALWGGDGTNANTTIEAGLPNITGKIGTIGIGGTINGAFYRDGSGGQIENGGQNDYNVSFNASRSSAIYGNSDTVQPPAYRVNVWRRTA